jgi:transcriptional regulator of acetoin/glycerol metabolism
LEETGVTHTMERTRALASARDSWLETGTWPDGVAVRAEIAQSWQRSALSGVDPDGEGSDHDPSVHVDGPLWSAAQPVIDKCRQKLTGTATAVILADRKGRLLYRTTDDSRLEQAFDRCHIVRGSSFDESVAGTNAVGTVLEAQEPLVIHGGEHFKNALHPFFCVGVPIRHPMTRQLQGALNITCRSADANHRLAPFTLEAVQEIERRLYLASSRSERLLLQRYLSAERRSGRPVICLNDQIIISNPAAARVLDEVGQRLLWDHAARAFASRTMREGELTLQSGRTLRTRCQPIEDGNEVVGALVEIITPPEPAPVRRPTGRDGGRSAAFPPGLAGRSAAWRTAWDQARAFGDCDLPLLVRGETGVGKLALVKALFAEACEADRMRVFEGTMQPIDGAAPWIAAVREVLPDQDLVIVIRHLEALQDDAAQALASVIDALQGHRARLVGTLTQGDGIQAAGHPRLIDRFEVATVQVPPLRDRPDDLPDLLAELTRRHVPGDVQPRWLPEAIQTLARLDWPANVRQLDNIVRRVVATRRTADIRAKDLPEDVRFLAPRRVLSYIERVELDAIKTALQRARGNKVAAAELLGMSRATLYRKIRSFGVDLDKAAF